MGLVRYVVVALVFLARVCVVMCVCLVSSWLVDHVWDKARLRRMRRDARGWTEWRDFVSGKEPRDP